SLLVLKQAHAPKPGFGWLPLLVERNEHFFDGMDDARPQIAGRTENGLQFGVSWRLCLGGHFLECLGQRFNWPTDRREGALAANPAPQEAKAPETEARAAARVRRMVRLLHSSAA